MAREQIKQLQKHRVSIDRRVTQLITVGGWLVLVTLLLLIWHLFSVTRPLLSHPDIELQYQLELSEQERLFNVQPAFNAHQIFLQNGHNCNLSLLKRFHNGQQTLIPFAAAGEISPLPDSSCKPGHWNKGHDKSYWFSLNDNNIFRAWTVNTEFSGGKEQVFSVRLPTTVEPAIQGQWQVRIDQQKTSILIPTRSGEWHFLQYQRDSRALLKHVKDIDVAGYQPKQIDNHTLNLLSAGERLVLLGSTDNEVQYYRSGGSSKIKEVISLSTHRSLLLVTDALVAEKWSLLNNEGVMEMRKLFQLKLPGKELKHIAHISGDLVVAFIDDKQLFINASTGEITASTNVLPEFQSLKVLGTDVWLQSGQTLQYWKIENPASVISYASFWHKLWYDGYPEPDYVWQTSSASDQAQAKYSLVPLLMGSIKAAFLAIIVALPLAIGSAIYTAYYAGPRLRRLLKPYVEILEAIPSVVIGFLAAIWLLPVSENYLLAMMIFIFLTPVFLFLFVWLRETNFYREFFGVELLFIGSIILIFLLLFQWVLTVNPGWLQSFWGSDAGNLLSGELKSTFVLAIALGLAIIPTVFTIAEDAIYQVPRSLSRASFAMGASPTQTLLRIVLKVAMPGIISAIMLGFARAMGETMIVLMVSGNTPVADWSLLESMRSMTANLAIELPEAQPGSVHYQVLFLVALILFLFTFAFNTLAEFLRIKLRHRYKL